MKTTNIIYWISTILLCAGMGMGAVMDALNNPEAVKMLHDQLGYPVYFAAFIGVAKLLAVITILVPGLPKLKEWAYAGLTCDFSGATYSGWAIGGADPKLAFMLIFFAVLAVSYIYHRKRLAAKSSTK
jgi:uncharacterized membrane protein YphA (DoxX/SURF4 family)